MEPLDYELGEVTASVNSDSPLDRSAPDPHQVAT
jgi:hypothetical protein